MEEGTYMEKAMWTWRETRGSAKLTFGFNFIVLFTVFQLFMLHDKRYIPSIQGSRSIIFRYFLPVELNPQNRRVGLVRRITRQDWVRLEVSRALYRV